MEYVVHFCSTGSTMVTLFYHYEIKKDLHHQGCMIENLPKESKINVTTFSFTNNNHYYVTIFRQFIFLEWVSITSYGLEIQT